MPVGRAGTMFGCCGMSSPDIEMAFISSAKPPCGRGEWGMQEVREITYEMKAERFCFFSLHTARWLPKRHRCATQNREGHARAQQKEKREWLSFAWSGLGGGF